ncbi:MAG: hypothetical protein LBM05_00620 [Endomicrobium sp.]|nr:hypothetical protein [Endomicrobium sp.]
MNDEIKIIKNKINQIIEDIKIEYQNNGHKFYEFKLSVNKDNNQLIRNYDYKLYCISFIIDGFKVLKMNFIMKNQESKKEKLDTIYNAYKNFYNLTTGFIETLYYKDIITYGISKQLK